MPNIRNDSAKVAEAHRQADIIWAAQMNADTHTQQAIADALLDIWQVEEIKSQARDALVAQHSGVTV